MQQQELIREYESLVEKLMEFIKKQEKHIQLLNKTNDKFYRAAMGEYSSGEALADLFNLIGPSTAPDNIINLSEQQ